MDVFEQLLRSTCYCITRCHQRASKLSRRPSHFSDGKGTHTHNLNGARGPQPPIPSIPSLKRGDDTWYADMGLAALLALKSCMMPLLSILTSAVNDTGRSISLVSHVIHRAVTPPLQQLFEETRSGVRDDRYALAASSSGTSSHVSHPDLLCACHMHVMLKAPLSTCMSI